MHKVKQAVILAAGLGKRMSPLTAGIPKPLIRINGVRMIDTAICGLQANGITRIYIVVGWRKEQFTVLTEEYDGITLIENPYYDSCNNISSLYVAREHLEDSVILDGDQFIHNYGILDPLFALSGYHAVWTETDTDEWLMQVKNGKVVSCSRTGGTEGWQLFSISRWSAEDGRKLKRHLEEEFEEKRNRQIYWDDVVMFCHFEEYELGIREMEPGDVVEVDTIDELIALDDSYGTEGSRK